MKILTDLSAIDPRALAAAGFSAQEIEALKGLQAARPQSPGLQ
jgi:hypothetical protein